MKRIILLSILAIMFSCGGEVKPDPGVHYINLNCVIVEKLPMVDAVGKRTSKAFLIRSTQDTTLYSEYISLYHYIMSDSVYYGHEVGDTLHFDFIRKNRFFKK